MQRMGSFMIVKRKFTATIDGEDKVFRVGDKVDAKTAKELGLTDKPELAQSTSSKKTEE